MAPTPATVLSAFYTVLYSGSAGATVRASLGAAGVGSVISADDLSVGALPTAPFVALREGPLTGLDERGVQRMTATWWIYDDWGSYKFSRIDALIALIKAAYPEDTAIASCQVKCINASAPVRDASLGQRPQRGLVFQLSWR